MSLSCVIGRHRPSLVSITKHGTRLDALCDSCGLPLRKDERGRWAPAPPLARAPGSDGGESTGRRHFPYPPGRPSTSA